MWLMPLTQFTTVTSVFNTVKLWFHTFGCRHLTQLHAMRGYDVWGDSLYPCCNSAVLACHHSHALFPKGFTFFPAQFCVSHESIQQFEDFHPMFTDICGRCNSYFSTLLPLAQAQPHTIQPLSQHGQVYPSCPLASVFLSIQSEKIFSFLSILKVFL